MPQPLLVFFWYAYGFVLGFTVLSFCVAVILKGFHVLLRWLFD